MFSVKLKQVTDARSGFIYEPFNYRSIGLSLVINIIHWAILIFKLGFGHAPILIRFNVVYGPDLVKSARFAYLIPLAALVLLAVNVAISIMFYRREKLAAYFLNCASIAIQLIFLAATIILLSINA
ncbi:MAG TPA: hypothetical protein VFX17_01230 [Patescibacteria group bacterium]|nr:hypothetical protein [Patescibacteria group bacterium]